MAWNCLIGCVSMDSLGVSMCGMASVGVAWPHWVWHGLTGCGIAQVGVAWPQWVWHGLNGFGMASVDVA